MEQALGILVGVHRYWAYIVIIAAIVGLVASTGTWLELLTLSPRLPGTVYVAALDTQALIGIVLLLLSAGQALGPSSIRFEHPTTMILAVILAHVGQVMARRAGNAKLAARATAIAILVSLILVALGYVRVTQALG